MLSLIKSPSSGRQPQGFLIALMLMLLFVGMASAQDSTPQSTTRDAKATANATAVPSVPMTTAFTYQGRLTESGNPASGLYEMQFKLYDVETNGSPLPGGANPTILELTNVQVTNGVFTVKLDFGSTIFQGGGDRFLEIGVRHANSNQPETFTLLSPRQQLTPTPYAIRSHSAVSADFASSATSATTATTAVNSQQLGGTDASQFVQTSDPRLTDKREPSAGSTNYIQNGVSYQTGADFNIDGSGTLGGTLTANLVRANRVNAQAGYNLGGVEVLSMPNINSMVVGLNAGHASTGGENAFFGNSAGAANTTGGVNSFFGSSAGKANTIGVGNSFFGARAGLSTTSGFSNSFFGGDAGHFNQTGNKNSYFGQSAGHFNVSGSQNAFFGYEAGFGQGNNSTANNSFFGFQAGHNNIANENAFFGSNSGAANTTGAGNSFFGSSSGMNNKEGGLNSFFGTFSGRDNTTGTHNSFFGYLAGASNLTATSNSFFGDSAGSKTTSGGSNTFIGYGAGVANTTGTDNTFLGSFTSASLVTANGNTLLGASSSAGPGVQSSTAIGFAAHVSQSNSLVLGASVNVGIGTSAPKERLEVQGGKVYINAPGQGIILKSPNGAVCRLLTIDNAGAIALSPIACP